ncbi:SCO6745 family protein [Streptomyces sp. CA-250714]|uniref:SCO6745 family protein n=1 Tax=Streptomyces sp. CA-250714 TaxID=3240060 RepID=UPI003D89B6DE
MADFPSLARQTWHQLEPGYASVYFAPEVAAQAAALGYDTTARWPAYFALRAAPLGAATAQLVTATFYSFSPRAVAEHVPGIWRTASPEAVLEARMRGVDATLRAILGDRIGDPGLAEAAELARTAAEAADLAGRPLAAANAALDWPQEPHLVLWQAANVLREHRGDGHLVALQAAGLDGCEALVSFAGIGAAPVANFASRGWSEQEWAAARTRLVERGLLDAEGTATERGRELRDEVERTTDELAAAPYRVLGEDGCARLAELNRPAFMAVIESGLLPAQSTLGILTVQAPGPR